MKKTKPKSRMKDAKRHSRGGGDYVPMVVPWDLIPTVKKMISTYEKRAGQRSGSRRQ